MGDRSSPRDVASEDVRPGDDEPPLSATQAARGSFLSAVAAISGRDPVPAERVQALLDPREVFGGRYRVLGLIGKGGMGSVWRAEHTSLRTAVAIKVLDPKLAQDRALRARFLREAQAAAALQSVHVVRIFDHGIDQGTPYIAMEFLRGESLRERLGRGPLSAVAVAKVFAGACRGVARAHAAGIVHRDLKPDNIFLARDPELGEVVKVVDFGIAKVLEDADSLHDEPPASEQAVSTATGAMLGTPYYMSPEQLRGRKDVDARTDLWSLGIIAFECLTGKRPFRGDSLGDLVLTVCTSKTPQPSAFGPVPPGFDAWFAKAVATDPRARFQTIQELSTALEAVLAEKTPWLSADGAPAVETDDASTRIAMGEAATVATPDPLDDPKLESASGASHTVSEKSARPTRPSGRAFALGGLALAIVGGAGAYAWTKSSSEPSRATTSAESEPAIASSVVAPPARPDRQIEATATAASMASSAATATASTSAVEAALSVAVTFDTVPAAVEIVRAGKRVGVSPGPLLLERGEGPVPLTLRKPGYLPEVIKVVPSADRTMKVRLKPAGPSGDVLD